MSSREEFEAWLSREYPWGNEALDKAFFSGNDDNGYYTGGDFIYDGSSCADALFWAWRGWQESHKQGKSKCAALAAENAGLKAALNPEAIPDAAVEAFTETAIMGHDWNETGEYSWVENDTDVIRAVLEAIKPETPATDAFLAQVRASTAPDEATERDLFEEWVMESVCISKSTLEGLRTDGGYRNSTLSGKDYNGMWEQWKAIRASQLRQGGAE